jgi:SNF2 family DNA or RNA helicase
VYPHGTADHALKLKYFLNNPIIKVHQSDADGFLKEVVLPLSKKYKIEFKTTMKTIHRKATSPVPRVYLKELDNFLLIQPAFRYDQKEVELLEDEMILIREDKKMVCYDRHTDKEQQFKSLFLTLHPDFKSQEHRNMFYVKFSEVLKDGWFFDFFEKLRENNIEVLGSEKITRINYSHHKPLVSISTTSGTDWFDLTVTVSYGSQKVRLKDVQKSFLKGDQFIQLSDGKLGLLPIEWLKKFEDAMRMGEVREDNIKISKLHFSLVDTLYEALEETNILKEINDRKKKLLSFSEISEVIPPAPSGTTLRAYQTASFHWMNFLNEYGWGGCLADDMGLGKTLQMLTFLRHQVALIPAQPNLVVMPTTLIFNWVRETEKFYPELTFLVLHGSDRIKDTESFSKFNLIFITYSTLIRDIEFIGDYAFNYAVLDESQAIKNPNSQRYKAARLLKASHRLAMTGTPIENNTFDLYAQMSFVNPGLLGNMEFFRKEFSDPIDRKGDAYKADKLRKMIKPFMLHRTKEQVAKELPDKTETILYCEMEEEQKKVYNAFRDNFRNSLLNKIDEQGLGKSGMLVLDALLKLRQICNSPALLNTTEDYGHDSVKIRELMRHIQEKTGKHKILVFSQFVKMLKLVQKELQENNICFEYLDGAVKNREERVQRFREDDDCRVFLISLKAGGTGINLTEADYVYLIDPWWNPAVEAQAIDRTHRIGQTKKVFAYRMICKDTIEEKVLKLQEKKRAIAGELISTEQSFMKQLDKEDIKELFS